MQTVRRASALPALAARARRLGGARATHLISDSLKVAYLACCNGLAIRPIGSKNPVGPETPESALISARVAICTDARDVRATDGPCE
jgi:hypothetical protein